MKRRLPRWYRDYGYIQPIGIAINIALVAFAMAFAIWLACLSIYNFALGQARTDCHNFGTRIGKEVTYDNLSWGNWDCFVQTDEGWIPRDNLREVVGE